MLQDMQIADTLCMWTDGPWMLSTMRNTYPDENICVVPMTTGKTAGNLSGGTSLGMSSLSKHKEEAWKFIEFMTSDETLLKWNKETGNAPPIYSAWEDPYYADDRDWQVIEELAMQDNEYIIPANHYPESIALNQIMRGYLQAAYIGEMTPKELWMRQRQSGMRYCRNMIPRCPILYGNNCRGKFYNMSRAYEDPVLTF